MTETAITIALGLFGISLVLSLYRLVRGPDVTDRILALDTLNINAIGLIILGGLYAQSSLLFEIAMLIALMGFVATVSMARFLVRDDVIE